MTAAITNPFKLTWGTFVVGGTTEKLISGIHQISRDFTSWSITLDVEIRATSDATLATNCAEMESEFSKRRQLILFQVGTSTVHTFNPAGTTNTGLNSWARIDKTGTPGKDTDRSRHYTISVGCELPATDTSGRRDSSITVDYDPAQRRTVTIRGTWTAITTNNATAQYVASIAAFTSSALGALIPSGTFELISQRTDADDQDKTLQFERIYRETDHITDTILADANIVEATINWTRSIDQPGDSGGGNVKRLETITCSFSCFLDYTLSTDLPTLYTGTIRPYIVAQLQSKFSPSQFAIVNESPMDVTYGNNLSVGITFQAAIDATDVIESVETSRVVESSGIILTGAWTGGIFDKYADQGIGVRRRFGIRAIRVLGSIGPRSRISSGGTGGGIFGVSFSGGSSRDPMGLGGSNQGVGIEQDPVQGGLAGGGGGTMSGWILIDNDSAVTPRWLGQPGGDQIAVTDLVEQTVEEWVESPDGGGQADFGVSFTGASN